MDTKDPLIEATVKQLSEDIPWVYRDKLKNGQIDRVEYLTAAWASGSEEEVTKLAYEWVKTGVLKLQDFHKFIHNLAA